MEYKQNGKIFSYTKKILTVSFFSLILSLSLSEKGTFAAPANDAALTVESSNSASDGIDPSYKYKTDDKSDEKDKMAGRAYYVPNADGETASATVLEDQAIVFSRIKINSSQSEGQASKDLKVNKITIGNRPPLGFSVIVLSKNDPKIEIEPPIGEKVSNVKVYLMDSDDKREPGDIFKLSENITAEDKGKSSAPSGSLVRTLSLSVKPNDPSSADNVGSDSSESMSDVVDESQSSDTGSKSGSESSSGSSTSGSSSSGSSSSNSSSSSGSYKSSSSSAGTTSSSSSSKSSSSTSKSSSSGSSSASKSASTKTFGSSFNPLFLFSGVCIPWLKKKKH